MNPDINNEVDESVKTLHQVTSGPLETFILLLLIRSQVSVTL